MNERDGFGVALMKCFFCGNDGIIVMNRILSPIRKKQVEEMHGKVANMVPCSRCEQLMKQGVILLTYDPDKSDPDWNTKQIPDPYRTGGYFVVTEAFCAELMPPDLLKRALKNRWMFIEHEAAESIGLFAYADLYDKKLQEGQKEGESCESSPES